MEPLPCHPATDTMSVAGNMTWSVPINGTPVWRTPAVTRKGAKERRSMPGAYLGMHSLSEGPRSPRNSC